MPALLPAVALAIGIALGIAGAPDALPLEAALPLILLAGATGALGFAGARGREVACAVAAGCLACGVVFGARAAEAALDSPLRRAVDRITPGFRLDSPVWGVVDRPLVVEGTIVEDAAIAESGVVLALAADTLVADGNAVGAAGGLRVTVSGDLARAAALEWRAGRRVRAPVLLRRSATYRDEGVRDPERALALDGVALVGVVKSAALVEVLARGPWWREGAAAARAWARATIAARAAAAGPDAAAVVAAILIGDRAGLTPAVQDRLQRAGTYHVIAISGGNIALVVGVLLVGLTWVGGVGAAAHAAGIASVVAYAALVTGGASVARATVMAIVYLGARLVDHRSSPFNAAAVAGLLILAAAPLDLVDAGFQLTVGATFGILVVSARARTWLPAGRWWRAPLALLLASAAADAFLLPIAAWRFSRLTLAGLALNFAAIPLMSVAEVAGLVALVASPVPPVSVVAGSIASWSAAGLLESARLVDLLPGLAWRVPPPPIWLASAYLALLVAAVWPWWRWRDAVAWRRWIGRLVVAAALAAAAAIALGIDPGAFGDARPRTLRVTCIDVGQGDATLVQFPGGPAMLVDAGGGGWGTGFDAGARVVAPAVWARGVRTLDWLVLTHGDPDHVGGALSVLDAFRPREVWEGIPVEPFAPLADLRSRAAALGLEWRHVYDGTLVDAGGVRVHVWHPPPAEWDRMAVRNDDSVVIELRYGDVSIVLPGDVEREAEQHLAPRFRPAPFRILKMPHHGSRTSSTWPFVRALAPIVAIASAGRGNRFGHPAPDVLARYESAGASIWRTDEDGEITIDTDGRTVTVRTYTGRSLVLTTK